MDGLEIGNRMKEFYENVPRTRLMRRCPVALRMDGKAFKHYEWMVKTSSISQKTSKSLTIDFLEIQCRKQCSICVSQFKAVYSVTHNPTKSL